MASTKSRIISAAASVAALLFAGVLPGFAQTATQVPPQQPPIATSPGIANPYPDFFDLAVPGRFSLTLFGGGFYSDKYGVAQEGFQFEQSITRYIGVVGRASGVELWNGNGFANPFASSGQTTSQGHAYIGRFMGGIDFVPLSGLHFITLGGGDVGDSHAAVIEEDVAAWLFAHSQHPLSVSGSVNHDFENEVTSISMDLQMVAFTTEEYMLMLGAGGVIYTGGVVSSTQGQAGPDLSLFFRNIGVGVSAQGGYGDAHGYGQLSVFKQFSFLEY